MTEIQLVDVSLRDGNQSLWGATGLTTAHIVQIAPVLGCQICGRGPAAKSDAAVCRS